MATNQENGKSFRLLKAHERILLAIEKAGVGGLTREEMSQKAYVSKATLSGGGYLRDLRENKLIYISGWRRSASGSFSIPCFSLCPGEDVPRPRVDESNRAAKGMERIVQAIQKHGPMDYKEIALMTGLSSNTVKNSGYLDALVSQEIIHISSWRSIRRGPPRPVFEIGNKKSAERPSALNSQEKSRRLRERSLIKFATSGVLGQLLLLGKSVSGTSKACQVGKSAV